MHEARSVYVNHSDEESLFAQLSACAAHCVHYALAE